MASSKLKAFEQIGRNTTQKHLLLGKTPITVNWSVGCPNKIGFDDRQVHDGTCLRCKDSPCIKYSTEEIALKKLSRFPINTTCDLCPTDAIKWPYESESPIIDEKLCIGCGLCASRCPAFAIYFNSDEVAIINDKANDAFVLNKTGIDEEATNRTIKLLHNVRWTNPMIKETDKVFASIYEKIQRLMGNEPNLLVRNILIKLGLQAGIRRAGDVNIRMDIVFEEQNQKVKGVGEVEFGMDVLSTSRNTLDNIAVFISRYEMGSVLPAVFLLTLPNQRSEYWQVIKDIRVILKTSIRTVTLGALLLFLWNKVKLPISIIGDLYSDADNFSTRGVIESAIGRKVSISGGLLGIIEPEK
ncbi:MAG: 4Fe-4S binding protein [Candidatus Omnitrophica bacterium]|nr:4Fe-4S binding protein [Candidatus Omnitrophota bacterium]